MTRLGIYSTSIMYSKTEEGDRLISIDLRNGFHNIPVHKDF